MPFGQKRDVEDWDALTLSPVWVLSAITGRYRDFDPRDLEAFAVALDRAAEGPGVIARRVADTLRADLASALARFTNDGRTISSGMFAVAETLALQSPEEAHRFRQMLCLTLGMRIAKARGPYGQVADVADVRTLRLLAAMLSDPSTASTGAA